MKGITLAIPIILGACVTINGPVTGLKGDVNLQTDPSIQPSSSVSPSSSPSVAFVASPSPSPTPEVSAAPTQPPTPEVSQEPVESPSPSPSPTSEGNFISRSNYSLPFQQPPSYSYKNTNFFNLMKAEDYYKGQSSESDVKQIYFFFENGFFIKGNASNVAFLESASSFSEISLAPESGYGGTTYSGQIIMQLVKGKTYVIRTYPHIHYAKLHVADLTESGVVFSYLLNIDPQDRNLSN